MKNLQRVVWAKGMLLTPQHFQAHSNYMEDALHFRFTGSCYANWGVLDISINEEELVNGNLTLKTFKGVLPEGTPVNCFIDPLPVSRPIEKHFPSNDDLVDVYLAIPERLDGHNVRMEEGDTGSKVRYSARLKDIQDENGLDEDKPVQFAQRNFSILLGKQNLDGYARLRIAQIARNAAGGYVLNPDFIPPLLNVAASRTLLGLVKRLVEILGTKSESLSSARRMRGKTLADFNVSESGSFWLLHTINTFLPELKHIHDVRRGHPEPLYLALLKLAGALSTFSLDSDARNLPVYDHDNLGPCFAALELRVRDLLETVIPSKCISIPLKQNQRIWTGTIANDDWLRNSQMVLAISAGTDMGVDDLIQKVPRLVRLAPPDEMNKLISLALPALLLKHTPPPSVVPYRLENQYFLVNQTGRLWEGIVNSRSLSLFIPPDFSSARPELYVVLP